MNSKLIDILTTHLTGSKDHIVKIESQGLKLVKSGSKRRYAFSLSDIVEKYVSITKFLQALPEKGFDKAVVFSLQKVYGSAKRTTYHLVERITVDITADDMNTDHKYMETTNQFPVSIQGQNFLGAPELVAKMVEAERSADYKAEVVELKEHLKDLRSRNRSLEEKNNSLTLKLDTAKERAALKLERELLQKKSFLETPAFEKTMETLGGILPKVLEARAGQTNQGMGIGLASPKGTQVYNAFIQKLSSSHPTDEQLLFFNYLLDNWKADLIKFTADYIEQKEQEYEDTE